MSVAPAAAATTDTAAEEDASSFTTTPSSSLSFPATIAVRWMVYAAASNVEVAHLSNVCQSWRTIVKDVVLEQALEMARQTKQTLLVKTRKEDDDDNEEERFLPTAKRSSNTTIPITTTTKPPLLLLASMLCEMALLSNNTAADNNVVDQQRDLFLSRTGQETYCLTWLSSEGITQSLFPTYDPKLDDEHYDDDNDNEHEHHDGHENNHDDTERLSASSLPNNSGTAATRSGSAGAAGISRQQQQQPPPQRQQQRRRRPDKVIDMTQRRLPYYPSNTPFSDEEELRVSKEWRGYTSPYDILYPFGYTNHFVDQVLQQYHQQQGAVSTVTTTAETPNSNASRCQLPPTAVTAAATATPAVRGATLARPESYCLCLDEQEAHEEEQRVWAAAQKERSTFTTSAAAASSSDNANASSRGTTTSNSSSSSSSSHHDRAANRNRVHNIHWQEYEEALFRRQRRRRQLQRDVLPRVLSRQLPPPPPPPPSPQPAQENNHATHSQQQQLDRKHCALQFLNASGSHAVCMMTPPFACGPVPQPLTIFCVAIATEDGCFLSGLHHGWELGHMRPRDDDVLSKETERSPICLTTQTWWRQSQEEVEWREQRLAAMEAAATASKQTKQPSMRPFANGRHHHHHHNQHHANDEDGSSSAESSEESHSTGQNPCTCQFEGVCEKMAAMDAYDDDDDEDDADESAQARRGRFIHRGQFGPGAWHCYTAIYDGKRSRIRIDGVEEPLQHNAPLSKSGGDDKDDQGQLEEHRVAMLDGLTLGSDHCFDLSLCCGQGSDGEGEGAIAEVAAFHGLFDETDLQAMEGRLMAKHGIPTPNGAWLQNDTRWQNNDLERRACGLFLQGPPGRHQSPQQQKLVDQLEQKGSIPLRFMTRHPAVAWKQWDPVTGKPRRVARIGVKHAGSSSDF